MNTEIKVHELKTWPEYFQEVKNGNKNFEFRDNDRDFKVGDTVILKEWKPNEWTPHVGNYTGDEITMRISYVLTEGFGLPFGKAIISLLPESVATPEAEIEKKAIDNFLQDYLPSLTLLQLIAELIQSDLSQMGIEVEYKQVNKYALDYSRNIVDAVADAMITHLDNGYKAAIKKDEPDLVAKDNYEPSKIHPQPSEPVASHSCTEGNSIEQDDDEDDFRDDTCPACGFDNGEHMAGCPEDNSPYAELLRNGYD
jgi:hypothetical protein